MKIGVLGSGVVGRVLASGFLKHGHQVMLGSRSPAKPEVQQWVKENPGGSAGDFAGTALFAEVAVLATLGRAAEEALEVAGLDNLAGKTIIDATNPIADAPPEGGVLRFTTGPNESLGERLQAKAPRSRLVKAFNSVGSARMVDPKYRQGVPTMFLCGDDAEAKATVSRLIADFGWEPLDCGGIVASRAIEPLCLLWCIPGFLRGQWGHAFKLLTE
jgi:predicted dinucleotide-binding enzyme